MSYISSDGLNWRGVLKGFAKSTNLMQPIFEAFTNSLEAIDMRKKKRDVFSPYIKLDLFFNSTIDHQCDGLVKVCITDNGIGFDDDNFKRLKVFKDDTKGYNNRGSGRIQFIHSFTTATYESIYKDGEIHKFRKFVLSKSEHFLQKNSIIYLEQENDLDDNIEQTTSLSLDKPRIKADIKYFNELTIDNIKKELIDHYILYFCVNRNNLPMININYYQSTSIIASRTIVKDDIPETSHDDVSVNVPLSKISSDMKRIENTHDAVDIQIKSYKLPIGQLRRNEIKVTCKGEVVDYVKVKLDCLPAEMQINESFFLFLLSSPYFDEHVGDNRDTLEILNKTEFKKRAKLYGTIEPQIILDDLEKEVSNKASEIYLEIGQQKEIYKNQLDKLKQTYLLSDEALAEADLNDSIEDILRKAYVYDAKLIAERDAAYHAKINRLDNLNPVSPTYRDELKLLVDDLSKTIPIQDKESLSRYVTHRRLVLDLMNRILERKTEIQNIEGVRNEDEKLLHNLLFSQHSYDTRNSDLWMLNEDYMYFKGVSEEPLNKIVINGKKLFRDEFSDEEERYLTSLGENRKIKRPDILLFPAERKCIIIELKTPSVNISDYITQIKKYAYWLRNFSSEDFVIDTFYGYLIGESIEPRDVRAAESSFKHDPRFNYMYTTPISVQYDAIPSGNQDGSLYLEVLSYSVLLQRAESRNQAFISIIFPPEKSSEQSSKSDEIADKDVDGLFNS